MSGATKTLTLELTGRNTGLGRMFSDSGRQIGAFQKQVEGSSRSLSVAAIASKGLVAGATALAAGLSYAVTKALAFDKAMRNVNSLSKLNETQFAAMEKQVISMSTKLPQSATVLAEGLYDIASSGFQGADGLTVLDAAARSASAGLTSTATSSKAITAVLNAYGLKAKDAADVSDVLFSTVNLGVISFDELANNLGDVVGATAAAKVGIDEVGAAIATMTLSGIKGAQATTALSSLTTKLVQPSTALADLYDQLGYKSGAAALETKGLHGVMEDLRVATGGNITTMLELFPDIEAARGALALMANDGANYNKVADQITDKTKRVGATQEVLDEQMKGVSAQWQLFTNRIDAAAITIGVSVLPKLTQGMQMAGSFGDAVGKMAGELKDKGASGLDNLGTSAENVKKFLEELGRTVISAGKAISDAVGDDAVQTFNDLAAALSKITGFALDNQGAVIALGLAYGVHMLGGVQALNAGISVLSGGLSKATSIFTSLVTPRLEAGADIFDKMGARAKAAGSKVKAAFVEFAPAAAMGGVLALAVVAWQGYSKAAERAGDITKGTQKVMNSFKVDELGAELQKAQEFIAETGQRIDDIGTSNSLGGALSDFFNVGKNFETLGMEDNLQKVQESADDTAQRIGMLQYNTVELFKVMGKPLPDSAKWINDVQGANGVVAQNVALQQMNDLYTQLGPKLKAAGVDVGAAWSDQQFTNAVGALRGVKDGTEAAAKAQSTLVTAMGGASDALGTTADAADALKNALDGLMGASLGIDQAQIDWRNGLAELNKTLQTNGASLSLNTQKGRDNRAAMIGQVQSLQDLLVAGANAGESQETLTGRLLNGRDALIKAGTAAKIPKQAMIDLLAQYKLTPDLVTTLIKESGAKPTKAALEDLIAQAKTLDKQKPKPVVAAKTAGAEAALARVNHMLDTLDGKNANTSVTNTTRNVVITERSARAVSGPAGGHVTTEADGGVIARYADGKMPDQAVIQQAVPGGLFQWAEPETKGEAFIPLAEGKRARSEKILSVVADKFGLVLGEKFASGGFRYPAFKYPKFRYDPKGGARTAQSRAYLADKASRFHDYESARYAAYEDYKDRIQLAQTASGRGAGALTPGSSAGEAFANLGTSAEARAQAAAELYAKKSRSPSDDAADYYKKPTLSLKQYMASLKLAETSQRKWNRTLRDLSTTVGTDVVKALQGMGEEGEAVIKKMATASVKDMKKMAAQIRAMEFTKFFSDTASDVKGQAQFQANLQALVKMGRADLASRFEQMGYDSAAGLAATALISPGSTLTQLNNLLAQQEAFNDPKMQDAFKLAKLIQASGGKLGVMGLSQSSGQPIGDVLGLLTKYDSQVFGKIPAAAMKQIRTDQALLRSGKQPSGHAMGTIIRGSDTGYFWGEPSSGGESLIPHGLDRRKRALDLWHQTGRILGAGSAGGSSYVTIAPGAINLTIPISQPGASVGQIQAVAQRTVSGAMDDLARLITTGRRS